ncbi:glycosyltransferase [Streptomyces sp. NBC_01275]|uniref:glycosyltransferase n=1 Tax=Streptomyces sp. NBC_01275 TaxID=2903807 RepID=UPI0022501DA7|nr:glycosyltransferase [Streptomyces sp. NBC_01275]MCX4762254.1 glycosyltransferase [Streptomyces sp. NBC_01275]
MHQPEPDVGTRVLHLTQPVDGGVARVVSDLTRAQLAAGLHVTVACPDSALAEELRSLGADVRRWQATRSPGPSLPGEVRRLARVLDEARPELVHAHSAKAGLAGRLAVRGRIPTVFQPHAWSFEAVGGATAALALRWERFGARWADRLVCVSEAERTTGLRAGIAGRWSVVPNGIDPERFRPAPAADAVRAALLPDLEAGAPLVVCVGRLCRQKGQDVLLDAWADVLRKAPGARLALVGDGPDLAELRARAPESVRFAGAVADVAPWYQAADLVVLPSRWEGMALAPLEALACGRPVVVTDVDGARESLPAALAPRCLVPAENPAVLAAAVAELLLDPPLRESLGRQGRRHVLSTHDVRGTARAVAGVYGALLTAEKPETTADAEAEPRVASAQRLPQNPTQRPAPCPSQCSTECTTECRESIHS